MPRKAEFIFPPKRCEWPILSSLTIHEAFFEVPLTSMAYFCLTVLEGTAQDKRQQAATKYGISMTVLNRIGRLSTEKGGPHGARKGEGVSSSLTPKERHFLEEAVKKIIRRAAEKVHDPDTSLKVITMSDLPSLEETP